MSDLVLTNVTLDIYAALITLIIMISTLLGMVHGEKLNRVFLLLCLMEILMLSGDAMSWAFGGCSKLWHPQAAQIGTFILYTAGFISLMAFTFYVHLRIGRRGRNIKSILYAGVILSAIGIILLIVSQFNHMFYYFNERGVYQRGEWFLLSQLILLLVIAINAGAVIYNRNCLPQKESAALLIYALIPLVAAVAQQFTYVTVTFPATTLSILLIFYSIQMEAMREMKDLSERDTLTNLFNRTKFDTLSRTEYPMLQSCGVIWFDINNLKETNDACGHMIGDQIIRFAADSIRSITSRRIHGYRLGGDEFMVIVCDCREADLESLVKLWRIRFEAMKETTRYPCSVAVGKAWAEGNFSLEELIQRADNEMYQDKNRIKFEA